MEFDAVHLHDGGVSRRHVEQMVAGMAQHMNSHAQVQLAGITHSRLPTRYTFCNGQLLGPWAPTQLSCTGE